MWSLSGSSSNQPLREHWAITWQFTQIWKHVWCSYEHVIGRAIVAYTHVKLVQPLQQIYIVSTAGFHSIFSAMYLMYVLLCKTRNINVKFNFCPLSNCQTIFSGSGRKWNTNRYWSSITKWACFRQRSFSSTLLTGKFLNTVTLDSLCVRLQARKKLWHLDVRDQMSI